MSTSSPSRKRAGSETCVSEGDVSRSGVGNPAVIFLQHSPYFSN